MKFAVSLSIKKVILENTLRIIFARVTQLDHSLLYILVRVSYGTTVQGEKSEFSKQVHSSESDVVWKVFGISRIFSESQHWKCSKTGSKVPRLT